jgi:hypothetical protein
MLSQNLHQPPKHKKRKRQTFPTMNTLFLALISLFAVASSVQGEKVSCSNNAPWSSNVTMPISNEGAQAATCTEAVLSPWSSKVSMQISNDGSQTAACSEAALSALNTEVSEWLRHELIDLFGEGSFTLGQVTGVEDGNTISLAASVECLECSKVTDKTIIAYILLLFMQSNMEEWIEDNSAGVLAGCMGEDTTVSTVFVGGKKAVSVM